jgi:hypothetical protein
VKWHQAVWTADEVQTLGQYATMLRYTYIACLGANTKLQISLFHRAFQFTMCNGPTNALIYNKTLIQMSYIKILKTTPTCFDHQLIIIRELI